MCSVVHPLPLAPLLAPVPAGAGAPVAAGALDGATVAALDGSAFLRGGMVSSGGGEREYLKVSGGGMRNGEGAR